MPLKYRIFSIVLILAMLFPLAFISVSANTNCSLTVLLEDKEKNPINGIEIEICKVADLTNTGYMPSESFSGSGISVSGILNNPSGEYAKGLLDYINEKSIKGLSLISQNGKAVFNNLEMGIWLVYCKENQEYSFKPFFVFLPQTINGELCFNITSTPKTDIDIPNNKSIYVVKKWEDRGAENKRPSSITIDLIRNDEIIDSVILSKDNGWSHTFKNLPKDGTYLVNEHKIPDYTVKYSGDSGNGFIVTNIYNGEKLPQTGQLWWPIAIIAIAGAIFVVLGIIELKGKRNEK